MRKVIIIGASSGIGRALAEIFAQHGYAVGIAARRLEQLQELQCSLTPAPVHVMEMDVTRPEESVQRLHRLIDALGGVDIVVISAGIGHINAMLDYNKEQETIDVNVSGFVAIADAALHHFMQQGQGHLVGISSIAALRGGPEAPAYNASKAFVSNYLAGVRALVQKKHRHIFVTDIQPGFVDTAMAKSQRAFWVEPVDVVARQIYTAITHKRRRAIVTRKWLVIAWLFKIANARG